LPAAEAESVHGPVRRAAWLGGGLLAVWGHDDSEPVVRGSVVEQRSRPAGLRVVDTRTWRAVTVHANAGAVAAAGGRLLAWGRLLGPPPSADVNVPAVRAFGLTVFGPGDRRPLHLFGSRQVSWLQVSGGRAYVDLTPSSDWWVATCWPPTGRWRWWTWAATHPPDRRSSRRPAAPACGHATPPAPARG